LYGSEELDMTISETWEDFESALTSVLLDLEEREMITIKLAGGEIPFIQFAGLGSLKGVDEIRAEFSAENVEDDRGGSVTFTSEQRAFFTQAGFAVAKEGLVWRRDYPWPTPSRIILEVVAACITRLRDVAGIDSPQQLCYMAWRYPVWRETPQGEEYIPGEVDLPIPELGIPHE